MCEFERKIESLLGSKNMHCFVCVFAVSCKLTSKVPFTSVVTNI